MAYVKVNRRPASYTAVRTPYERRVHNAVVRTDRYYGRGNSPAQNRRAHAALYKDAMNDPGFARFLMGEDD